MLRRRTLEASISRLRMQSYAIYTAYTRVAARSEDRLRYQHLLAIGVYRVDKSDNG